MRLRIGIVWFRHDLRLSDNQALTEAAEQCDVILPVYVFEEEQLFRQKTSYGFRKMSVTRAKFLIESVSNLQKSFRDKNVELIVRVGKAEEVVYDIAKQVKSTWVYCNRERTPEEEKKQDVLEQKLWQIGQEIRYSRGKLLYHTGDLPFPIKHTPDTYAAFYREAGKIVPVRKPLPIPDKILPYMGNVETEPIPTLEDLGYSKKEISEVKFLYKGGEYQGLKVLDTFMKDNFKVNSIKQKRTGRNKVALSTMMSPYLNFGCVSPKTVYAAINRFMGNKHHKNRANCIIHGLLRRDYLKLMQKKYKEKVFEKSGIADALLNELKDDMALFDAWRNAQTGVPIVDAFMRELNSTGFVSFEGRRVLSQFLIEDLKVNWVIGAQYFQSKLVDYNPCSNYGNWNIVAGAGFDAKEDRYCNFLNKAKKIDPDGNYVRKWVPELNSIESTMVHEPHKLTEKQLKKYKITLGKDYPTPIVGVDKWV